MPPDAAKGPHAPSKRRAEHKQSPPPNKKAKLSNGSNGVSRYKDSTNEIKYGIVQREFYPPEMTNERAKQYIAGEIERPIKTLENAVKETQNARDKIEVKDSVVHYFKCDIRTKDNHALHLASEKATSKGVPLIGLFIVSPQDWQAHVTSAVRVDFVLRTLEVLKRDLAALDIPLNKH
jgi:deoxyribodipyrimidine photo-lyase